MSDRVKAVLLGANDAHPCRSSNVFHLELTKLDISTPSFATMESSVLMRQLLRTPASCRAYLTQSRAFSLAPTLPHARFISTPTILRPSFWASMIPKPLKDRASAPKSREWNPATPYIILSLLVGSQAIQILWLKQERAHSLRRAEAKIGVLKEVIERVQNGEDVDVEKVLGTGDAESEKEWAEGRLMDAA
ncbi:hypothetical protein N0V95_005605 [Ascochyta clinopodiicola]|nr:hypothetical protein N0V95_005605 [Ascochyta clinopodiicola]